MIDDKRQIAIEKLAAFDDPTAKPPAGVVVAFKAPAEARDALRELAKAGLNPSAILRQKLAEVLAEAGNGNR